MWGLHGAYTRLDEHLRVVRVVAVADEGICVADWIEGTPRSYAVSLPLHPDATWEAPRIKLPSGLELTLSTGRSVRDFRGSERPFDGWWSETYGSMRPATRLEWTGVSTHPVAWSIGPANGSIEIDNESVTWAGCQLVVRFFDRGVELEVRIGDGTETRRIGFIR
jgi:hypothetical protein